MRSGKGWGRWASHDGLASEERPRARRRGHYSPGGGRSKTGRLLRPGIPPTWWRCGRQRPGRVPKAARDRVKKRAGGSRHSACGVFVNGPSGLSRRPALGLYRTGTPTMGARCDERVIPSRLVPHLHVSDRRLRDSVADVAITVSMDHTYRRRIVRGPDQRTSAAKISLSRSWQHIPTVVFDRPQQGWERQASRPAISFRTSAAPSPCRTASRAGSRGPIRCAGWRRSLHHRHGSPPSRAGAD